MKKQIYFLSFFLIAVCSAFSSFAQGVYDLRLIHSSFNCKDKKVLVCVEIRATSADSAFKVDGANINMSYLTSQLTNPVIKTRDNFTSGFYNAIDFRASTNPAGTAGLFSLLITSAVNANDGTLVGTTWMKVASIEFDLTATNSTNCYSLNLLKTSPSTVITKIIAPTKAVTAMQGAFTSLSNQCPTKPTVALSSNMPTNLVFTLTDGDLPVTVSLTDGTSVTMLQGIMNLPISPTKITVYQIQSVSNNCSVGLAAANADKVSITPSATPVCVPTCPVITAVKRTL